MVSKDQRKLQKRKKREKETYKKILANRMILRAKAKEEKEEILKEKRIDKLHRDLERLDQHFPREMLSATPEDTLSQLERNVEILRALEAEHAREMETKQKINEDLESKGYLTLEEKMEALQEMALAEAKEKAQVGVGGSADCKMSVNTEA
jgi:hypothetical protein